MTMLARFTTAFLLAACLAGCQSPDVSEKPADAAISERVRGALAAVNIGRDYSRPLRIETTAGRVVLHGFVVDNAHVYTAGVVAARVRGVTQVENRLLVMAPQGNPNPFQIHPRRH